MPRADTVVPPRDVVTPRDVPLPPMTGLLLDGAGEAVQALPLEADAALLHVRLCHDRRP